MVDLNRVPNMKFITYDTGQVWKHAAIQTKAIFLDFFLNQSIHLDTYTLFCSRVLLRCIDTYRSDERFTEPRRSKCLGSDYGSKIEALWKSIETTFQNSRVVIWCDIFHSKVEAIAWPVTFLRNCFSNEVKKKWCKHCCFSTDIFSHFARMQANLE